MYTLRPGLTVFVRLLPVIVLVEVMLAVAAHFDLENLGVTIIMHGLIVYFAHWALITGQRIPFFSFRNTDKSFSPGLGFFGLVVLLFVVMMVVSIVVFTTRSDADTDGALFAAVSIGLLAIWVALFLFGMAFPRSVYRRIYGGGDDLVAVQGRAIPFIAFWMAVYAILYYVLFIVPFLWLATKVESEWAIVLLGLVGGIASYVPTCLTASVLSHAFLRANGLPPQGLIRRV